MKKVLSILLAICLMVGMVSVLASADAAKQAYVKMPFVGGTAGTQKAVEMSEGDDDLFYKTTDAGLVDDTAGATAADYNIKLSFPVGGALTISLNGAKIITPAPGSGQNGTLTIGYDPDGTENDIIDFDCVINVEADSVLKGDWTKYDGTASSVHGIPTINCKNTGTLTITGPGLLDVFANSSACISKPNGGDTGAVIFKDANFKGVKENPQPKWGSENIIDVFNTDVIFDNTKADMTNNHDGIINHVNPKDKTTTGKITIKNGSDIKCVTTSDGLWNRAILNAPGGITVENSKLLLNGVGESQYAVGSCPIKFVGVNALGGNKESNTTPFSEKKASGYYYLVAGPDIVIETDPTVAQAPTTKAPTKATKPTTATKATQPAGSDAATKPAGSGAATKPAGTAADGNNATTGNDATTPVDNNTTGEKKGGLTWLYILLGVVILAGAAVLVLVIVKRNAAAAELEEEDEEVEGEETEEVEGEETEEAEEETEAAEETAEEPETTEDAE